MDRTIVVQLQPTPEQARLLQRTLQEHTACFNAVARLGFDTSCSDGVELHKATYYPLRTAYPDLPAQLVGAARVKATEAVKSALTWKQKHAANYPKKVAKAEKAGRKPPVSKHAAQFLGWTVCSADLCWHQGRYFLHIVVSQPAPIVTASEEVIGVDLGLNRPAVTSTRVFLGDRRWKEQERRLFRLRRALQKKGTKSAKRHLKKLSGQLFRQRKDHDHILSKRLVQHAAPGATLVLENLSSIRDRSQIGCGKQNKQVDTKRKLHSWSFAHLWSFISYKAEARGVQVVKVDPRHTSQQCSRCGHIARNNRRSQSLFLCRACRYCCNADLNASYNLRDKHLACLASVGRSFAGGSPVKRPLVSTVRSEGQAPRL